MFKLLVQGIKARETGREVTVRRFKENGRSICRSEPAEKLQ
jgi:hypothetical protein